MTDDKIEAWLKEIEGCADRANDGKNSLYFLNMKKLLALVRVYRDANKWHMTDFSIVARAAEEKAKEIIGV